MLHDMFPIQDMASRPMEEVPIVQQPTKGPTESPNEDRSEERRVGKECLE